MLACHRLHRATCHYGANARERTPPRHAGTVNGRGADGGGIFCSYEVIVYKCCRCQVEKLSSIFLRIPLGRSLVCSSQCRSSSPSTGLPLQRPQTTRKTMMRRHQMRHHQTLIRARSTRSARPSARSVSPLLSSSSSTA